ncbi:MAG: DUF4058 family protein [Chloroflexia bacterium]|nr:DUF4058 family protein [Chloroflexia bacterium]
MELPFPGMDPYLEQPGLWPDVHTGLITGMRDTIQAQLNPNYVAVITPYIALESIEIAPTRRSFVPDIEIVRTEEPDGSGAAIAIVEAPLILPVQMQIPTRYARIEIRSVLEERLVTSIELLSPANKRPGADGADAYEQKRQELFASDAHLLEIDLLRSGVRPRLARPLPEAPYFIFLSRSYRRPLIEIWPVPLQSTLPVVPVPLTYPDPDVALDLTRVLHQVYRNACYERRIDYCADPPPPPLSHDEIAWLDARLREQGLRK